MALPDQFLSQAGNSYKGDLGQSAMSRLGALAQSPDFQRMALGALQGSQRNTGQWVSGGGYNFYVPGQSPIQGALAGAGEAYIGGKLQDLMQEQQGKRKLEDEEKERNNRLDEYLRNKADKQEQMKEQSRLQLENQLNAAGYENVEERKEARKEETKLEQFKANTARLDKVRQIAKEAGGFLKSVFSGGKPKWTAEQFRKNVEELGASGQKLPDSMKEIANYFKMPQDEIDSLYAIGASKAKQKSFFDTLNENILQQSVQEWNKGR